MTAGRNAARAFAHTLAVLFVTSLAVIVVVFGQDIEAQIWPVVGETQPTDHIYRDKIKACFKHHLIKLRDADEPVYRYYAEAHLSPRLPISIYPSDDAHERFGEDLVTHKRGEKWDRVFCFELPATAADNQYLMIYGYAEHNEHRGWLSQSYFKTFKVCGLMPDNPPPDIPRTDDPYCDQQRRGFHTK